MQVEIITIGDEILIGQIVDTNSQWLGQRLNEIGVSVYQITSIQDDRDHILKALAEAENNADIVIITGGLGPTKDDITKHTLADYFEDKLVRNAQIESHIRQLFERIKYRFTDKDLQQAMLPAKAMIFKNDLGTASGMWFEKDGKIFISLPGVPDEMKGLMTSEVMPALVDRFRLPFILHKTLYTYGLGESRVADRLESWEDKLPDFIKLAYLPSYGKVRLRLTARGKDLEVIQTALVHEVQALKKLVHDIYVGEDEPDALEMCVNRMLTEHRSTLSLAESCTGGNIAKMLTAIPGASSFMKGALVAYSADVKENILGVPKSTIEKHTVVSEPVVREMALHCKNMFQTDFAIATTGNAGPSVDDTDKGVGVVFIGIATPVGVFTHEFYFGKLREKVIERASVKALELLRKEISKNSRNSLPD